MELATEFKNLGAVLDSLNERVKAMAAREAEMSQREADLAEGFEALGMARQESAIWAEATAARDRHWRMCIGMQLEQLTPECNTARVLRRLEAIAVGQQRQMEG